MLPQTLCQIPDSDGIKADTKDSDGICNVDTVNNAVAIVEPVADESPDSIFYKRAQNEICPVTSNRKGLFNIPEHWFQRPGILTDDAFNKIRDNPDGIYMVIDDMIKNNRIQCPNITSRYMLYGEADTLVGELYDGYRRYKYETEGIEIY